jgi:branched-chain amino acid transport system ATP-binding protein
MLKGSPDSGLSVSGVAVQFGGLRALEDVTLSVPPRSVVGLVGPNGAGKTTLFNVVSGFVRPSAGQLTWDGHPFHPKPRRLVRQGIARTLQDVGLFPHLTAVENVMLGRTTQRRAGYVSSLLGLPGSARDERESRRISTEWLDRLGVAQHAERQAAALPYPVQKRVALARALVTRPRLLLLDEPAGGLGAEDFEPLAELVKSLPGDPDSPCSVLLVEHHMDFVMGVCDQVVVLDFGRLVAAGTPSQIQSDPAVAAAYLGIDPTDIEVDAGTAVTLTEEPA